MLCYLPNRHKNFRTLKVRDYIQRLEHAEIENAQQESLWLISHALGVSHSVILSRENFSDDECAKIESVISRRINGEPLQYILGEADFYGRDFHVGRGVLIPRQDTETLIDAMKFFAGHDESFYFADWGTGSGCIAITLMLEFKNSYAYMIEQSRDAITYANHNLERYDLTHRAKIISRLEDAKHKCRFIISNPPYIPSCEIDGLMKTVRDYEPLSALDGGHDGMNFYRLIIAHSMNILTDDGYIIFETGNMNQVHALESVSENFMFVREFYDADNFPRSIVLRRRCE